MNSSINMNEILEKHKKWLNNEPDGEQYFCAYGEDLSGANLSGANLSGANLSRSKGLLNPAQYMADNFEHDDLGWIVYKVFGAYKTPPQSWVLEPNSIIEETANPERNTLCSSGINFGTLAWIKLNIDDWKEKDIWRCRVRWVDACGIIVPFDTDGKCRCNRLELIEIVKPE